MATGQIASLLPAGIQQAVSGAIQQAIGDGTLVPPGVMYVALETPLGNAYIDPFAAAQDPVTQQRLVMLGINVTLGLGASPAGESAGPSLTENLKVLGLVGAGLLAVMFLSRRR